MEHIVINTRGAITGLHREDLHIFIDGRRSPRTRRKQILDDWYAWTEKRFKQRPHAEPVVADFYWRLGKHDDTKHTVPFVGANQWTWTYTDDWTIFAHKPYRSPERGTTQLIHRDGTVYRIDMQRDEAAPPHRRIHIRAIKRGDQYATVAVFAYDIAGALDKVTRILEPHHTKENSK